MLVESFHPVEGKSTHNHMSRHIPLPVMLTDKHQWDMYENIWQIHVQVCSSIISSPSTRFEPLQQCIMPFMNKSICMYLTIVTLTYASVRIEKWQELKESTYTCTSGIQAPELDCVPLCKAALIPKHTLSPKPLFSTLVNDA